MYYKISKSSKEKYNQLLNHKEFIPFYQSVTPVDEISLLKVGSRPSKRKDTKSINDLRAIPWVLSWSQNRSMLPAWYGLGTAFKDQNIDSLREAYANSLFFKNFIELLIMVMSKSKPDIFNLYFNKLSKESTIKIMILEEYNEIDKRLKLIKQTKQYILSNPKISQSIKKRNPYVDPLNILQIIALKEYREYSCQENLLVTCFSGIANGLKNSG